MTKPDPSDVRDTDDRNAAIDHIWGAAIEQWRQGHSDGVRAAISDSSLPIPPFARDFLSDLAAGKARRRRGAPPKRTPAAERALVMNVFEALDRIVANDSDLRGDTPLDAAIASVAESQNMTDTELRGVYEKLRSEGLTREVWSKYMRSPRKQT